MTLTDTNIPSLSGPGCNSDVLVTEHSLPLRVTPIILQSRNGDLIKILEIVFTLLLCIW